MLIYLNTIINNLQNGIKLISLYLQLLNSYFFLKPYKILNLNQILSEKKRFTKVPKTEKTAFYHFYFSCMNGFRSTFMTYSLNTTNTN